jgi:ribosomal protein S13
MAKKLLSKVEKAQMHKAGVLTSDDLVALKQAVEEMPTLEQKVANLTEKQIKKIVEKYGVDPVNTLDSLKGYIHCGISYQAAMQYKSLKSVL